MPVIEPGISAAEGKAAAEQAEWAWHPLLPMEDSPIFV